MHLVNTYGRTLVTACETAASGRTPALACNTHFVTTADLFRDAQFSVMRMLIGEVTPEMRAVTVEVNARHITIRVYHDGAASDEAWQDFDSAMTEVFADFEHSGPDAVTLDYRFIRCDAPTPIPAIGRAVFARKGTEFRDWTKGDPF